MGKGKSDNAIRRQWDLLKLLPLHGSGLTSVDIARQYSENQGELFDPDEPAGKALLRKVQRDLTVLEEINLVTCNDHSKPFGWKLNDQQAYFARLSESEALFLALSERSITPLLPPNIIKPLKPVFDKAKAITNKHSKIKPPLNKRIVHASVQPLISPSIPDEILEVVHHALTHNKILTVSYQATYRPEPTEMNLHVYGLFQNAPSTYMIAQKDGTQNPRFFALHRIKSARLTTLNAKIPKDFNIDQLLQKGALHFGSEGEIKLELRANPIIATILGQTPLSLDQTIELDPAGWGKEECYKLRATVNLTWDLRFWLLSHGSNIEVLKPVRLRNSIIKELTASVARYT